MNTPLVLDSRVVVANSTLCLHTCETPLVGETFDVCRHLRRAVCLRVFLCVCVESAGRRDVGCVPTLATSRLWEVDRTADSTHEHTDTQTHALQQNSVNMREPDSARAGGGSE